MKKEHPMTRLAYASKDWANALNNGGQSNLALEKINTALVELAPKLTQKQMNLIRVLIGSSSSCAYSKGVQDSKQMQRDNEFREFKQNDSIERPSNVVKFGKVG